MRRCHDFSRRRPKITVLISDKSAIIRVLLEQHFKAENDVEEVYSQSSGKSTLKKAMETNPDVIILNPDCSDMDGKELLEILAREKKFQVIVICQDESRKTECISLGAVGFLYMPGLKDITESFYRELIKITKTIRSRPKITESAAPGKDIRRDFKAVCIGASTGGPKTVAQIFRDFGPDFPLPILFVQHIEVGTDRTMARWFKDVCPNIPVVLAKEGMEIKKGTVYMAPAATHLEVYEKKERYFCHLSDDPEEHFLKPSVNHLFRCCASVFGTGCLGVLLTGMGRDGAEGCREIIDSGGYTIAESRESCVVFGMPGAAVELNAASEVLSKEEIPVRVLKLIENR